MITGLAIAATGLRKSFGNRCVLDGVDLRVHEGSVFALLGPNGAGKTTVVHILSTLLRPDAGSATIGGHDLATEPGRVRAVIGVTGQFSAVDNLLTGEENLMLMARLRHLGARAGQARVSELLDQFELTDAARQPLATYSGGMRRRLDLAMTLVGRPQVIFLDEPTTGLDPRSRRTMWEIVRELVHQGTTVFLTTQYLDEADGLAERIAVLDLGRVVAQGTPDELKRLVPGGRLDLTFTDEASLRRAAGVVPGSLDDVRSLTLQVPSDGRAASVQNVLGVLAAAGVQADRLAVRLPDLDDVFFALTGRRTEGLAADPELVKES